MDNRNRKPLTIRKATSADAAAMTEIITKSWEAAYTGLIPDEAIREKNMGRPAMWQSVLAGEHNNYIALADDIPVGLLGIHACRDDDIPPELKPLAGEVGAIYLHPDFWDRGYGRELMDFALNTLAGWDFSVITLWVLRDNVRARRFYEKCGFAFDGTEKEVIIGKPIAEVRYRKEIAAVREIDIDIK